jgi:hypothetical protein
VRFRRLGAAAAVVLAVGSLAACRTNVGTAATVDGHRITESDVNDYITPDAGVSLQQSGGGTFTEAPRSFVVRELIEDRLFRKLLANTPGGAPSDAKLDSQVHTDLAGKTQRQVARSIGLRGFTDDFLIIFFRVEELGHALGTAQQNGANLTALAKSLNFPVSVSARYGSWNQAKLNFNGTPAVPGYLSLQSTAAAAPAN